MKFLFIIDKKTLTTLKKSQKVKDQLLKIEQHVFVLQNKKILEKHIVVQYVK